MRRDAKPDGASNDAAILINYGLNLVPFDPSGYFKLKDLLNPFSKDNPIGLRSSEGRAAFGFAAGLLPFADYNVMKSNDKFYLRNPELQFVPKIASGVVAAYFPALWWLPAVVDAHFTRINGGDASDVLRSFTVGIATSYASGLAGSSVFAQAAVGCASAAASGGNCGQGALAMGFSTAAGNLGLSNNIAGAMITGGVAAELGGGDFWEGAKMAGIGYVATHNLSSMDADAGMFGIKSDGGLTGAEAQGLMNTTLADLSISNSGFFGRMFGIGNSFAYVNGYAYRTGDRPGDRDGAVATWDQARSMQSKGYKLLGGKTDQSSYWGGHFTKIYRGAATNSEFGDPSRTMRWVVLHEHGHQLYGSGEEVADAYARSRY